MIREALMVTACVLHSSDKNFTAQNCKELKFCTKTIKQIHDECLGIKFDTNHNNQIINGIYLIKSGISTENTYLNGQYVNKGSWLIKFIVLNETTKQDIENKKLKGVSLDISANLLNPCSCDNNLNCDSEFCHKVNFISIVDNPCNFLDFEYESIKLEV
ncbi:MAG: XkdF-like putative serine protease domain-containing protein [Methanobrevibacter sp.]|jgi:hypothetical protein|nr:XkdF-like putative serine protease domain-containing protein [Methanobrevibacter sp.]